MKRILAVLCVCMVGISFCPTPAPAAPVKHGQCYTAEQLTVLDKQDVAGGKGTLHGEFAFTRDAALEDDAIKEIGWITLRHGEFIGTHTHKDNEDAYLIVSGHGVFTDGDGNA